MTKDDKRINLDLKLSGAVSAVGNAKWCSWLATQRKDKASAEYHRLTAIEEIDRAIDALQDARRYLEEMKR